MRWRRRTPAFFDRPFNVVTATSGVVKAWLRNTTVGALSSWPDVLNPSNPATGIASPTGNADFSVALNGTTQGFTWASAASNFTTVRTGYAFWLQLVNYNGSPVIIAMRTGGFVFQVGSVAGKISADVVDQSNLRRTATMTTAGDQISAPVFITWEYDGGQAAEADKCFISINNAKQALTFTNNGLAAMPATMHSATTPMEIGKQNVAQFVNGKFGRNLYALQGAGGISGGGLLTTAQRAALMSFEPLT